LEHTRKAGFRPDLDSAFSGVRPDFALRGDAFMTAGARGRPGRRRPQRLSVKVGGGLPPSPDVQIEK
jgi:hypothetical protein